MLVYRRGDDWDSLYETGTYAVIKKSDCVFRIPPGDLRELKTRLSRTIRLAYDGYGARTARESTLATYDDNPRSPRPLRGRRRLVLFLVGVLASWTAVAVWAPKAIAMTEPPSGLLKAIFCALVIIFGLACAILYLLPTPIATVDSQLSRFRDRPWRRMGAAICLLVSVMFVLGVYLVDIPEHPKTYATFWLVIMMLVLWACALAVKDVWYTHRLVRRRRMEKLSSDASPSFHDATSRDSKL